jgi:hypothetical protein
MDFQPGDLLKIDTVISILNNEDQGQVTNPFQVLIQDLGGYSTD